MLQKLNLNKSTKRWLNYIVGGIIGSLLLWGIYLQIQKQLNKVDPDSLWQTGPVYLLIIAMCLMPINLSLEAKKWHLLTASAQKLRYRDAFLSYLAGIAFSIITPNNLGEYPGRILYLRRKNTFRLVSVSVLGAVSQFLTLFIYGMLGLIYYNITFPGVAQFVVLISCFIITAGVWMLYWRFEKWAPLIERIKWMRKYHVYGKMLRRFTFREQATILSISLIRYSIYTAQYLILLHWMNVSMPIFQGFFMCALFFWVTAIIPSITIIELTERGAVSLFLFKHFSENTIGILSSTVAIWCINLIIPAILGSLLLFRMRFLR
jgi:hypothetical protein